MSEAKVTNENALDVLAQIRKTADSALTTEKAEAMIKDYMSKIVKEHDPAQRRGSYEVDSYFDQEKPSNIVQLHKSAAWSKSGEIKKAQEMIDDCYLMSILLSEPNHQVPVSSLGHWREAQDFIAKSELGKAMDTATAASGGNWVPTELSRMFVDLVEHEFRLAQPGLFPRVNMTRSPMQFYRITSRSTPYIGAENTTITESNPGTGNDTLTAKELCVYVPFSYDLEEDSILPLVPILKDDMQKALVGGVENAIINGDTSVTHQDSDVTGASDVRKAWSGLRYIALNHAGSVKVDLSTFNFQTVLRVMQKLEQYADPGECFWTVGPKLMVKLLNLKDECNNPMVATLDKLGPNATFLKGQIAIMAGAPVIMSEKNRENVNQSGVYDGTTATKTTLLYTRKDAFVIGDRRKITIETDKDIVLRKTKIVATTRMIFDDRIAKTEKTGAIGYNIDPTV